MPAFTAIAIDRLFEPASLNPNISRSSPAMANLRPPFAFPALYATPAVTPLPDYPSSFPPSPYIVNHKRRGPRLQKPPPPPLEFQPEVDVNSESKNADLDENLVIAEQVSFVEESNSAKRFTSDKETEYFADFLHPMRSVNYLEDKDARPLEIKLRDIGAEAGEFYDAYDELSSDGGLRSPSTNFGDEIREIRLNLLIEIEKRKQAEDFIENLQIKWQNLCHHLSTIGFVLQDFSETQSIANPAEDLSQQIIISREVATSIARGRARAAIEIEMEPQITKKNFEIARLLDRLRYSEATLREMSQRNQEAVEMARRRRHHRRSWQKKWFYASVALVAALGSATIAWSYLPSEVPSTSKND